jgi:hypothetical protein
MFTMTLFRLQPALLLLQSSATNLGQVETLLQISLSTMIILLLLAFIVGLILGVSLVRTPLR